MFSSSASLFALRLLGPGLLVALLALAPAPLPAQPEPAKKEISEQTGAALGRLRPLIDAKDYAAALALITPLLDTVAPASFDRHVLAQIQAQILLTQGKLLEAIAPLELALRLGDQNPAFVDPATRLEQLNLLAQLHYQRATELKDPPAQRAAYLVALGHLERRLALAPPTAELRTFASSLHYQLGTLDPEKPDAPRIQEAITQGREALLLSLKPANQLVLLLAACHLQLGQNQLAAELLETLATRDPKSASTWSQLQSIYLAAAADAKDPQEARRLNLRALHTLDRAQTHGHLSTPRDHYTRVAILFNIQQYTRAAALLEKGLADGTLENTRRNWELLASAYQQTDRDEQALDALTRATAAFPADSALEFSLAQFLYNTGRTEPAYLRAQAAHAKGLEKPAQAEVWLAYLAYELQRHDEADRWLRAARASGGIPDTTLDPLGKAIAEALRSRS